MALFGHKINYISPVFGFWVIKCNKKHVVSNSSHFTPQHERSRHIFTFSTMLTADISLQGCPHPTWERTHLHSPIILIFSPVVKFMSFVEEKELWRFLSGPKFCIYRYMIYNFHCSISEHYRQWHTQSDTLTVAHSEWNTHSGTLTVAHSHDKPTNARFEASAASRWELRSFGLLSSEYS